MIREPARIIAIDDHQVWVASERKKTCQSCQMKKSCCQGVMADLSSAESQIVSLPKPSQFDFAHLDDEVDLAITPKSFLLSALWVYLFPLFAMISSALFAQQCWPKPHLEWISAIAALVGFGFGFLIIKLQAIIGSSKLGQITILPKEQHE